MKYVIMANGKGTRWGNYGGIPKHLIQIEGETLLQRTVRLLHEADASAEVTIAASNPAYVAEGATRHKPQRDAYELDRFCYELIRDDVCFLYGDVFYTPQAIALITQTPAEEVLFFGSEKTIVAVKAHSGQAMKVGLDDLFAMIDAGKLEDGKGWHLYHQLNGMPLQGKEISQNFVMIDDVTTDFNRPEDLEEFFAETSECE